MAKNIKKEQTETIIPVIFHLIPNKLKAILKGSATCPEGKELALLLSLQTLFKNLAKPVKVKGL